MNISTVALHIENKDNFFRKLLLICLGMVVFSSGFSQRFAVASGDWSNPAVWSTTSGGAPGATAPVAGTPVTINSNVTVTVSAAAGCGNLSITTGTVNVTAQLTFSANATITLTSGILDITNQPIICLGGLTFNNNGGTFTATGSTFNFNTAGGNFAYMTNI